jgi:hypothetical protein
MPVGIEKRVLSLLGEVIGLLLNRDRSLPIEREHD